MLSGCATKQPSAGPSASEGPNQVTVSLTGLQCCDNAVRVALYQRDADWLKSDRVFKARLIIANSELESFTFYGLPAGTYAIAAFQDTNDNGSLDRWLGLFPKEPVAFSNVSEWRKPPSFADASFSIPILDAALDTKPEGGLETPVETIEVAF